MRLLCTMKGRPWYRSAMRENPRDLLRQALQEAGSAATDPHRWDACIAALSRATDAAGAALFRPKPELRAGPVALAGTMVPGADVYWSLWVRHDPWNLAAVGTDLFQKAGEIRTGREFLSDEDYRRSPYYEGIGRQRDSGHKLFLKICDAADPLAPVTHLTLSRSFRQEPFGNTERAMLRRLWPHLRHSVQTQALLGRVQHAQHVAESALHQLPYPCWVLRADGSVDFANRLAEAAMQANAWLCTVAGRLVRLADLDAAALRALVAAAAAGTGGHQLVAYADRRTGQLCRAAVRIAPIAESPLYATTWPHAHALLLLELPVPLSEDGDWINSHVAPYYGLTPNERRTLEMLAMGQSVAGIAQALNITEATVRTHLRGLREKTGRRSQAALVRLGLGR